MHRIEHIDDYMKENNLPPIILECRYVAPGLTFQDIYEVYWEAEKGWEEGDNFSANPFKWQGTRGVSAVIDLILNAVYNSEEYKSKEQTT